jgi:protein subunit release factor A
MSKKELLFSVTKKDFNIDWFSGRGAGGQNRNKNQNCVRLKHPESGAMATGQSNKSRQANLREALKTLTDSSKFKIWINRKSWEVIEGKTIEDKVEESMKDENIKVEYKYDGGWVSDADL